MTVVSVVKDFDNLTLTIVAEFDPTPEEVWQLWADPRLLERWWGPPEWPATFEAGDLTPGGEVSFFMAGPDGQRSRGWWRITSVDPPRALAFTDGFADADGVPLEGMPTTDVEVELTDRAGGGTRMVVRSTFSSPEHLQSIVDAGAVEVFQQTIGQMDALLAA